MFCFRVGGTGRYGFCPAIRDFYALPLCGCGHFSAALRRCGLPRPSAMPVMVPKLLSMGMFASEAQARSVLRWSPLLGVFMVASAFVVGWGWYADSVLVAVVVAAVVLVQNVWGFLSLRRRQNSAVGRALSGSERLPVVACSGAGRVVEGELAPAQRVLLARSAGPADLGSLGSAVLIVAVMAVALGLGAFGGTPFPLFALAAACLLLSGGVLTWVRGKYAVGVAAVRAQWDN